MAVMDEFKQQRADIRKKPLKAKLQYFWDYYKVPALICLFLILFAVYFIHAMVTRRETVFTAAFINGYFTEDTFPFMDDFAEVIGLDTDKQEAYLDDSYQMTPMMDTLTLASTQKFTAMIAAGDGDVVVSDPAVFAHYGYNHIFDDIRKYLTPAQIALYQDQFFYMDASENKESTYFAADPSELIDESTPVAIPDYRDTSEMTHPVPIGIYLTHIPKLDALDFHCDSPVFGIPASSRHADYALQFLDYITTE